MPLNTKKPKKSLSEKPDLSYFFIYPSGFNGQERDDELAGVGNFNTALYWEYETRLGRRWNVDPKPLPGINQYACFNNNPIWYADPLGDSTWVTQTNKRITINTSIEFSGKGLYNKKGELRKSAIGNIEMIKKDIKSKWSGSEYEGKEVEVNLITKTSLSGGTEKSYDQITVERGGGRSEIRAFDKSGKVISSVNQIDIIRGIRAGTNDYNIAGTFFLNSRRGTFAHEYGHMLGYWDEDYVEGKFDSFGAPEAKQSFMNKSLMRTTFGVVMPHVFQRVLIVNPPKFE